MIQFTCSACQKLLQTDEGASGVGEIAIGTNDQIRRFSKNMLFDEKMGGTIHLAVGRAFPAAAARTSPPCIGTCSRTCARAARFMPMAR